MLMIAVPNSALDDLAGAGHPCRINGAPTTLRRDGGYLVYADADGTENRCMIVTEVRAHDHTDFMAASHGEEGQRHNVLGLDENSQPIDITGQRRVYVPDIRLVKTGAREQARRMRQMHKAGPDDEPAA
jgi:hypothetical protein